MTYILKPSDEAPGHVDVTDEAGVRVDRFALLNGDDWRDAAREYLADAGLREAPPREIIAGGAMSAEPWRVRTSEPTAVEAAALSKVMRAANEADQTVYPDEDIVGFTRAECRAIWSAVLGFNQEISDWRERD
jgi:hypothetical protein